MAKGSPTCEPARDDSSGISEGFGYGAGGEHSIAPATAVGIVMACRSDFGRDRLGGE